MVVNVICGICRQSLSLTTYLKVTGATTASVSGGIQLQYTAAASPVASGVVSGSGTGMTAADGSFQQQLLLQSPAFCKFDRKFFHGEPQ